MQLKSLSLLVIILSLLTLSGCAQPKIIIKDDISIGSLGNKAAIIIEDIRPQDDKEFTTGSMLLFKDNYGIWTLGDKMFTPTTLELLKNYINSETSKWKKQPKSIKVKLKRLKFEANHQATMLAATSTQLGPLGIAIAEGMHGKKFELKYDKTRPYILGFIDADVYMTFNNRKTKKKSLSVYKAENFASHMDVNGRIRAATNTIKSLYSSFSKSLK